jgi:hypothetical protein
LEQIDQHREFRHRLHAKSLPRQNGRLHQLGCKSRVAPAFDCAR